MAVVDGTRSIWVGGAVESGESKLGILRHGAGPGAGRGGVDLVTTADAEDASEGLTGSPSFSEDWAAS